MVQKGKLAACAFALDRQLKRVDLPTLGSPTIPAFIVFYYMELKWELKWKLSQRCWLEVKRFALDVTMFRLSIISDSFVFTYGFGVAVELPTGSVEKVFQPVALSVVDVFDVVRE